MKKLLSVLICLISTNALGQEVELCGLNIKESNVNILHSSKKELFDLLLEQAKLAPDYFIKLCNTEYGRTLVVVGKSEEAKSMSRAFILPQPEQDSKNEHHFGRVIIANGYSSEKHYGSKSAIGVLKQSCRNGKLYQVVCTLVQDVGIGKDTVCAGICTNK